MDDLIEALQIFRKYVRSQFPTHCEHDILYVLADPMVMSIEDKERLEELHFHSDGEAFYSHYFGSA